MKLFAVFPLALTLLSLTSRAAPTDGIPDYDFTPHYAPAPPGLQEEWEAAFQDLSRRVFENPVSEDAKNRQPQKLKSEDGLLWRIPAPSLVRGLRYHIDSGNLSKIARLYRVQPLAVAVTIVAEQSLNGADKTLGIFPKEMTEGVLRFLSNGRGGADRVSVGLSQIQPATALEVEREVWVAQGRKARGQLMRTGEDIRTVLLQKTRGAEEEALHYTAAVIRHHMDQYQKASGVSIEANIPAQATLFNVGNPVILGRAAAKKRTALEARREVYEPKLNFFGLFAWFYLQELSVLFDRDLLEPAFSASRSE